jgi:GrpB-like predicted nucleotidyltransferase (UPF0157 family)
MPVVIEVHNPAWLGEFLRVKDRLQMALKDIPIISVEHVVSLNFSEYKFLSKQILGVARCSDSRDTFSILPINSRFNHDLLQFISRRRKLTSGFDY